MPGKVYEVFFTAEFEHDFGKLDKGEQARVKKAIMQLKTKPYTGKPLVFDFFMYKKIEGKRIYFLIYKEFVVVFVVAFGGKKTQQDTINEIKNRLPEYLQSVKQALGKKI